MIVPTAPKVGVALLFALNLSLAGVIWATLRSEQSGPPDRTSTAVSPSTTVTQPEDEIESGLGELETYAAISDRPLFSPTRRPTKAPPTPPPEKKSTAPMNLVLQGVIIDANGKLALIRSKESAKLYYIPEGDWIEGWVVEKILPEYIVVKSEREQMQVRLWRLKEEPRSTAKRPKKSSNITP